MNLHMLWTPMRQPPPCCFNSPPFPCSHGSGFLLDLQAKYIRTHWSGDLPLGPCNPRMVSPERNLVMAILASSFVRTTAPNPHIPDYWSHSLQSLCEMCLFWNPTIPYMNDGLRRIPAHTIGGPPSPKSHGPGHQGISLKSSTNALIK